MRTLSLAPLARLGGLAPLLARLTVGVIMAAHGYQKLTGPGPSGFGRNVLSSLGVPAPVLFGYLVTFTELIGGVLLVIGLLSRLAALALTINLVVAILLAKLSTGLIAPMGEGTGYELDLALIAGFLVVLFAGPGKASIDYAAGIEPREDPRRRAWA